MATSIVDHPSYHSHFAHLVYAPPQSIPEYLLAQSSFSSKDQYTLNLFITKVLYSTPYPFRPHLLRRIEELIKKQFSLNKTLLYLGFLLHNFDKQMVIPSWSMDDCLVFCDIDRDGLSAETKSIQKSLKNAGTSDHIFLNLYTHNLVSTLFVYGVLNMPLLNFWLTETSQLSTLLSNDDYTRITRMLQLLRRSPVLVHFIESLKLPPSAEIDYQVRADLRIPLDTPLTPLHTKMSLLYAMFASTKQGDQSICYLLSPYIIFLESNPLHVAQILYNTITTPIFWCKANYRKYPLPSMLLGSTSFKSTLSYSFGNDTTNNILLSARRTSHDSPPILRKKEDQLMLGMNDSFCNTSQVLALTLKRMQVDAINNSQRLKFIDYILDHLDWFLSLEDIRYINSSHHAALFLRRQLLANILFMPTNKFIEEEHGPYSPFVLVETKASDCPISSLKELSTVIRRILYSGIQAFIKYSEHELIFSFSKISSRIMNGIDPTSQPEQKILRPSFVNDFLMSLCPDHTFYQRLKGENIIFYFWGGDTETVINNEYPDVRVSVRAIDSSTVLSLMTEIATLVKEVPDNATHLIRLDRPIIEGSHVSPLSNSLLLRQIAMSSDPERSLSRYTLERGQKLLNRKISPTILDSLNCVVRANPTLKHIASLFHKEEYTTLDKYLEKLRELSLSAKEKLALFHAIHAVSREELQSMIPQILISLVSNPRSNIKFSPSQYDDLCQISVDKTSINLYQFAADFHRILYASGCDLPYEQTLNTLLSLFSYPLPLMLTDLNLRLSPSKVSAVFDFFDGKGLTLALTDDFLLVQVYTGAATKKANKIYTITQNKEDLRSRV